jgi:hypothetical protein
VRDALAHAIERQRREKRCEINTGVS